MKTPYQQHNLKKHNITRYSPDGIHIIEECKSCLMRFLLPAYYDIYNPTILTNKEV